MGAVVNSSSRTLNAPHSVNTERFRLLLLLHPLSPVFPVTCSLTSSHTFQNKSPCMCFYFGVAVWSRVKATLFCFAVSQPMTMHQEEPPPRFSSPLQSTVYQPVIDQPAPDPVIRKERKDGLFYFNTGQTTHWVHLTQWWEKNSKSPGDEEFLLLSVDQELKEGISSLVLLAGISIGTCC